MIKLMASWLDPEGMTRAYAYGEVDNYSDYKEIESLADKMLDDYLSSGKLSVSGLTRDDFTFQLSALEN